jgi:hypothetical protein
MKVGQVEARSEGGIHPDYERNEFSGKRFIPPTGPISGHSTMVGREFYGSEDGIAPSTLTIQLWDTNSFLNDVLHVNQRTRQPERVKLSVVNHSWIAGFAHEPHNVDAIRRLDFVAERDDVVFIAAVDNGFGAPFPKLLATGFNIIAVGTDQGSSAGPLTFDSRGPRSKPDMIAPSQTTSEAAGVVSGAATLLRSEARARHINLSALSTKALLLAGAQRSEDWERGLPGPLDDLKIPYDYQEGAGSLRVDHSFNILTGGRRPNGGSDMGWDTAVAKKKGKFYAFTTGADDDENDSFSAVLTWNRDIKRLGNGSMKASLTDLDLSLLIKSGRRWRRVAQSDSDYDNVETITLSDLRPGSYRLVVRGARPEQYSLAWLKGNLDDEEDDFETSSLSSYTLSSILATGEVSPTTVPEPGLLALLLPTATLLLRRRQR